MKSGSVEALRGIMGGGGRGQAVLPRSAAVQVETSNQGEGEVHKLKSRERYPGTERRGGVAA